MEKELFNWSGWDQQDVGAFTFYDAVLKVQIGKFPAGTKFDSADVDFQNGTLQLTNYGEADAKGIRPVKEFHDFALKLQVI